MAPRTGLTMLPKYYKTVTRRLLANRSVGDNVMKLLTILAAGALAFGALSSTNANATNLVVNGGFETGDFTGWTIDPVSYPMYIVTSPVYSGTYAAQIAGYSYGADTLTQTIATTGGDEYTLSFWIYQQNIGPTTFLDVTWDGTTIVSMSYPSSDSGDIPYVNFTAPVVGTGSDTLQFISANDPGWTYVDNVSLTSGIPEASTWAMMILGFAGLGYAGYRKTKRGERVLSAA